VIESETEKSVNKQQNHQPVKYLKNALQAGGLLLVAVCLAVLLRVFVFSTFKIPSPSMEPALQTGDYIIVDKLLPGARIFKSYDFVDSNSRPRFWRVKGIRAVKRNDVLVFNYPYTDWNKLRLDPDVYYVKRCVAVPGDTFYIENGIYKVKGCNNTLGNIRAQREISRLIKADFSSEIYNCFPFSDDYGWTIQKFGPLYIPRKGDCIPLNAKNIQVYRKLIEYETGRQVMVNDNQVLLNDSLIHSYTFDVNYYFMTGDLVQDSRDSRYWGLLPEDHIVGKASIIWKSVDPNTGKVRWDRVMKLIK